MKRFKSHTHRKLLCILMVILCLSSCTSANPAVKQSDTADGKSQANPPMKILVMNCGSTSLKCTLYDMAQETILATGECERIGVDGHIELETGDGRTIFDEDRPFANHAEAGNALLDALTSNEAGVLTSLDEIDAVGHRVVHGGDKGGEPVLIDEDVIKDIKEYSDMAPLHNPPALEVIEACQKRMGTIPQTAVFDTSFHQTMPEKAYMYAIPYDYYRDLKIRRYGFHGISHQYVSGRAAEILDTPLKDLKLVSCHLGGGASVCAIRNGKSIDVTMGFSPISGLPMGSRSGDIDPAIFAYLSRKTGMDIQEITNILNEESGFLGISGKYSDFRDLEEAAKNGDKQSALAIEMFEYSTAKAIGSYAAAMNGIDGIIFTAGIGENDPQALKDICGYLTYLGVEVDPEYEETCKDDTIVSKADSMVKVMVIHTKEDLMIARETLAVVK